MGVIVINDSLYCSEIIVRSEKVVIYFLHVSWRESSWETKIYLKD